MKRLATALVLVPVVTWLVLWAPNWAFAALLAVVGVLAFHEFDRMAVACGALSSGVVGMAAGLGFMLGPLPGVLAVLLALLGMTWALRAADLSRALVTGAALTMGVLYIFGAWRCAIELHAINRHWVMFVLLVTWAGDTAALYVGRAFGRHKLAPRLSPAKTWEGAVASFAMGVTAGVVYAHYLLPEARLIETLGLAAAGNVAGQVGDLCESAMKRGAKMKDSGTSLPGHGGWLDRVDASLFSIPVVYALLLAIAGRA
jgi:phosphatidate cytidylyltransferase